MDMTQTAPLAPPAAATVAAPTVVSERWFVRCADCLSVMAVEVTHNGTGRPAHYDRASPETQRRIRLDPPPRIAS